ncbi:MAG: hypothetical protein J6A85_09185 [Clostridia bacterium]|nr:hypothetical protein [Clostridia bacterium]
MITNDIFSKEEKRLLDFILNQDFENKAETVNYINSLNAESIVRDYSPHHIIMEFRTPNIKDGYFNMTAMVCVDIKKLSEDIATARISRQYLRYTKKTVSHLSMKSTGKTAALWKSAPFWTVLLRSHVINNSENLQKPPRIYSSAFFYRSPREAVRLLGVISYPPPPTKKAS